MRVSPLALLCRLGAAGLGTFLVLRIYPHNITERIGIAAPLLREKPRFALFVGLALLWRSRRSSECGLDMPIAPQWLAITLAIGAGAIAQVIELIGYLYRTSRGDRLVAWQVRPIRGHAGLRRDVHERCW